MLAGGDIVLSRVLVVSSPQPDPKLNSQRSINQQHTASSVAFKKNPIANGFLKVIRHGFLYFYTMQPVLAQVHSKRCDPGQ